MSEMLNRIHVQSKRAWLLEEKAEHWVKANSFPSGKSFMMVRMADGSWSRIPNVDASRILNEQWRIYRASN